MRRCPRFPSGPGLSPPYSQTFPPRRRFTRIRLPYCPLPSCRPSGRLSRVYPSRPGTIPAQVSVRGWRVGAFQGCGTGGILHPAAMRSSRSQTQDCSAGRKPFINTDRWTRDQVDFYECIACWQQWISRIAVHELTAISLETPLQQDRRIPSCCSASSLCRFQQQTGVAADRLA